MSVAWRSRNRQVRSAVAGVSEASETGQPRSVGDAHAPAVGKAIPAGRGGVEPGVRPLTSGSTAAHPDWITAEQRARDTYRHSQHARTDRGGASR